MENATEAASALAKKRWSKTNRKERVAVAMSLVEARRRLKALRDAGKAKAGEATDPQARV